MKAAAVQYQCQPLVVMGARGEEVAITIPVTPLQVLERINKALADDRQRLLFDGDRVVWIDLRKAGDVDLEEFARRHGHMDPTETIIGQ